MKDYALKNPTWFAIFLLVIFYSLMAEVFVIGELMSHFPNGRNIGEFIGKIITSIVFLIILWRFNWLKIAGINSCGHLKKWILLSPLLFYAIFSSVYAYTGIIKISVIKSSGDFFTGINMMGTGLAEEFIFRGLMFYCFVMAWHNKKNGLILSAMVSAIIFGLSHLIWVILGKDLIPGLLQALGAFVSGIFYAAIIVQTRSIWPAVIVHGLTNAFAYIIINHIPDYQATAVNGIMDFVLAIPLALYGLFILHKFRNISEVYKV